MHLCLLVLCPHVGLFPLSLCNIIICLLLHSLGFKVRFVGYKYCYPRGFFPAHLHEISFSIPLLFSLCVSFDLRLVSWRQHMYGSCFLIHSATLCLLFGAFKPFTFKVILDRYIFSAILLLDYVPLFPSHFVVFCCCCFVFLLLLQASPLTFVAVLVWC